MNYLEPTLARLVERMRQINIEISDNPTAQEAADALNAALADQAVCGRACIDGKEKLLKFCDFHAAVYGEKWVYVPHEKRGLMTEGDVRGVMK